MSEPTEPDTARRDDAAPPDDEGSRAWAAAAAVPDPEVPCVTVEDLGILRGVDVEDGVATARVTPTYSGCPAVLEIERAIARALEAAGFEARIERVLTPPWTSDWIGAAAREKLRVNGIAPPACTAHEAGSTRTVTFFDRHEPRCPRCGAADTERLSEFGSTACKAQHRCRVCREPFDHFKPF